MCLQAALIVVKKRPARLGQQVHPGWRGVPAIDERKRTSQYSVISSTGVGSSARSCNLGDDALVEEARYHLDGIGFFAAA